MCELEPYCRMVLRKHWPDVPLFEDIRELRGSDVLTACCATGAVDVVYGGFYRAHVSPSAWLETKKGKTTPVTCGRSFRDWSEKLNRVGSSLKTYLEYCVSQQMTYAGTWSVKVTQSGYGILKLRLCLWRATRPERNTGEKESFLWRTPDAHCDRGFRKRETFEDRQKRGMPLQLNDQVAHMLPTPVAHDAQNVSAAGYKRHTPPLGCVAGGSLNPAWIEWLMGFPIGWTDLEHSEMP